MKKIQLEFIEELSVAKIILDDGKGNVLDAKMMDDLQSAFAEIRQKPDIKLISFEGAGKHFSFGASVEEHQKEMCPAMLKSFHQLFYDILDMSIPTMAKISGQCLGGGMELALICNFLFADKSAYLGQPEIVLGVYAPPASIMLPMKIGAARAEDLLITGKVIKAEKALEIGLLNEVYEDKAEMNEKVDAWVKKYICDKSASSLRYAVRVARTNFKETMLTKLPELERIFVSELMETNDANEGIKSFMEKRKPEWKNC
jgi:cyclohexa-1,5-dienecarbonyl-CoA hydratase